jgi:hypothetical protein
MLATVTEVAAALRAPFPPEKVGKLPRVTCGKCRDSRTRSCEDHKKARCVECQTWITPAHIHLDYVSHADATDRLLEVDPEWTWEPFALDERGLPAIDDNGGMWIRLTVAGVTRIGYGDADGKRGGNAIKEMIGDAIRNASMRFGVALDLWRKEGVVEESTGRTHGRPAEQTPEPDREAEPTQQQVTRFDSLKAAVDIADSQEHLKAVWDMVKTEFGEGLLHTRHANALRTAISAKKAELDAHVGAPS